VWLVAAGAPIRDNAALKETIHLITTGRTFLLSYETTTKGVWFQPMNGMIADQK